MSPTSHCSPGHMALRRNFSLAFLAGPLDTCYWILRKENLHAKTTWVQAVQLGSAPDRSRRSDGTFLSSRRREVATRRRRFYQPYQDAHPTGDSRERGAGNRGLWQHEEGWPRRGEGPLVL